MEPDAHLREALVSHLERTGVLHSADLAAALRSVPRHRFVPGASLEKAYADRAIGIKLHGSDVLSSISQPGMIVQMLELLAPVAGERVLEIGTGSGYNASLLAQLVGPGGSVTTVDLDEELIERARETFRALGYENITALGADGRQARFGTAPYDRLVVSARADDIPAAWWEALREGARLVVPLRLNGAGEYAVGFVRREDRLIGVGAHPCAFIALRGDEETQAASDVFYRNPSERSSSACVRPVTGVTAIRRSDAMPSLLDEADMIVARPATLFAVSFSSS